MNHRVADGLLMLCILAPASGLALSFVTTLFGGLSRWSPVPVRVGLLVGSLSAIGLACLLRLGFGTAPPLVASWRIGTWIVISDTPSLPILWEFRAEFMTAVWLAVMMSVSWITLSTDDRTDETTVAGFHQTAGMVTLSALGFVLSSSLLQALLFWGAISWTTLAMVIWSTSNVSSSQSIRMIRTGLLADVVITLAVLLIVHLAGLDSFDNICSAEAFATVGIRNPPVPGLIGSLLILSALGRSGLFPCFGWHRHDDELHPSTGTMIYAVGYVPSGIWLLLKCQPVLLTSDVPMTLVGGLGTLGVALGAFVACGQTGTRRLACLVAAQTGVLLTSLGSGLEEAAGLCRIHQCTLSAATFALFMGSSSTWPGGVIRNKLIWCAALSLAGAFPFLGGWSQQAMNELNSQPARWVLLDQDVTSLDAEPGASEQVRTFQNGRAARWDWLVGLWIAQGLSTIAATMVAFELCEKRKGSPASPERFLSNRLADVSVVIVAILLLAGGLREWFVSLSGIQNMAALGRLEFNQFATIGGLLIAWRLHAATDVERAQYANWGDIGRLSHAALYIDQIEKIFVEIPLQALGQFANFALAFDLDVAARWILQAPAWLGREVESLRLNSVNFDLIVILLGTTSFLLTLILVS